MKPLFVCIALFFVFPSAYAATCNSYQYDKAAHFADMQGKELVSKKYDGGRNIKTSITHCDYNNYSNKYNVDIDVYWDGSLSDKRYNSSGTMTMNSDGSYREYKETYRNQNLKDYAFWRGMAMVTLAVGVAGAQSQSSTNQTTQQNFSQSSGYDIWVSNKCGREVDLIIRYKDAKDDQWKSDGWWSFSAGKSAYLATGNVRLKTNNETLYYAIKNDYRTTDYTISFNGSSYGAHKIVDSHGDTEVYLCN